MPTLETVQLQEYGIARRKNEPLSIWYGQPIVRLPDDPPFVPQPGAYATGLQILRGILEHRDFRESDSKPAFVILPELAIPFADIATARTLIAAAPKGTLVAFGAGQMTEEQALSIEAKPELWEGEAAGRFANCAVIGIGGYDRLFLQPKLLKSNLEKDWHWPGKVVRCFVGDYIRFSTFICSDLLNRPGDTSYMAWLHDQLDKDQNKLTFAFWLQHNPKPRSDQFLNAIEAVGKMDRTTVVIVGSRTADPERRFENYAVSGAFASRAVFPSEFNKFTHRFHYVERADDDVSRAVLLRYDADAYRVRTVLADALDSADKVEKGELFDSSQPYVFDGGALKASSDAFHIRDLCKPARDVVATRTPALAAASDSVSSRLVELGTANFLAFLDLGILPRPSDGERGHPAGVRHEGGDLKCRCWNHRNCVDLIAEPTGTTPLAELVESMALLEAGGCVPRPRYDHALRTNLEFTIAGAKKSAVVVYPFDISLEALQRRLFGERPPVSRRAFIFVADPPEDRPRAGSVNVAEVPPIGAVDPSRAAAPTLSPLRAGELRRAAAAGDVTTLLARRFENQ